MSHKDYVNIGDPGTKVVEECSELIKVICKAHRFGWESHHPDTPNFGNIMEARSEMHDVTFAMDNLKKHLEEISE